MRRADACAARAPGPDGLCLSGGGPIAIGGGRWRLALAARRLSPWDWTIAPARARVHPCCSLAACGFHAWRTGFGGWARARVWRCVCACACLRALVCVFFRVDVCAGALRVPNAKGWKDGRRFTIWYSQRLVSVVGDAIAQRETGLRGPGGIRRTAPRNTLYSTLHEGARRAKVTACPSAAGFAIVRPPYFFALRACPNRQQWGNRLAQNALAQRIRSCMPW
ncbi:hypothetical protein PT2222_10214 [Paraburkholderia tropica]|nr:hypothetical protein [Paraburkholderia tropica]